MPNHTITRSRWWLIAASGLAALALTAGIIGATQSNPGARPGAPRDLRGNPVQYDTGAAPNPEASAVPDGQGRFVAKTVGLNVPLGSLDAVGGSITPPGFTSAYLIRNYGVTPKRAGLGAVYVVMHSLRNGAIGPGNYLIDVAHKRARISVGAPITVGDVTYKVTGTQAVSKPQLPSSSIWAAKPGTLIVITCLQRPQGGPSLDNMVITAARNP